MKKKYRSLKQWIYAFFKGTQKANFIIVGAQKSGTTYLHNYLSQLPRFYGTSPKELHYFDRDDNYAKGISWYDRHFIDRGKGYYFESSPSYLAYKKVPQRIYEYNPNTKIIIILRDPIERAYSAWNMYREWSDKGFIPKLIKKDEHGEKESPIYKVFFKNGCPAFSDYIKVEKSIIEQNDCVEEPSILRRGIYYPQIKRYIDVFGHENVLILGFIDLKNNPEDVVLKITKFVSDNTYVLKSEFPIDRVKSNKRSYTSVINKSDKENLEVFYAEHNALLLKYLGYEVNW